MQSIVLVGLPGAGKTTLAPLVAQLLGCPWCDLDQRLEATLGATISDLFARHGEPWFRARERDAMGAALAEPPQVIAAGGGWAAQPGNLAGVTAQAFVVYLSLAVDVAARRIGHPTTRPLVRAGDVGEQLTALLCERESWYRLADIEVAVGDVSIEAAAAGVATAARQYAGW